MPAHTQFESALWRSPAGSRSPCVRPCRAGPGQQVWAYPNIHGDVIATAGGTGVKAAKEFLYDPYGQPLDPTTLALGRNTANDAVPDTSAGQLDNGWLGQHQRSYEHTGNLALTQMGARPAPRNARPAPVKDQSVETALHVVGRLLTAACGHGAADAAKVAAYEGGHSTTTPKGRVLTCPLDTLRTC